MSDRSDDLPRYVISVAARLSGVSPHTLRSYEKAGLIRPYRTKGNIRLYSNRDIRRIRQIAELSKQGVNYSGIKLILKMRESQALKGENGRMSSFPA